VLKLPPFLFLNPRNSSIFFEVFFRASLNFLRFLLSYVTCVFSNIHF
jgi:hypothetical protein